jgi:sugar phosphate permease
MFFIHGLIAFYTLFLFAKIADQGLIKIGSTATIGKWFQRYRGRAVGIVFFSAPVGVMLLAPIAQVIIGTWSWREAWLILGLIMLVLGVVPCALLVRRQPEDVGLRVDGIALGEVVPDGTTGQSSDGSGSNVEESEWGPGQVMRTPTYWLLLGVMLLMGCASGTIVHLVPYMTQRGLGATEAVSVISLMSTVGALAALLMGILAERLSPKLLLTTTCLLSAASMVVLYGTSNLFEAYLFGVMQGIVRSGVNTLAPLLWADYYGRSSLGSIVGISRASQVVGFAVGPLVLGMAYDATGSYRGTFIYFGLIAALASFLVLAARRPRWPVAEPGPALLAAGPRESDD